MLRSIRPISSFVSVCRSSPEYSNKCSSWLSAALIKHWPKTTWETRTLFGLQVTVHPGGKSGQALQAGSWSRDHMMEEGHWLKNKETALDAAPPLLLQQPWNSAAYQLTPCGLFGLLSSTTHLSWNHSQWAGCFHINHYSSTVTYTPLTLPPNREV